jgi:predicted DNA-binding protein
MYIQLRVTMGTRRVNFRIPEELIEKADVAATVTHRNRTEVVTEALREYLETIENEAAFKESVVDLYLDGEIGFEVLLEFLGRQDAESVRASRALLEEGEELAEDLADLE